ncbi:MAG TPA: hypothetical protein VNX23_02670 [Bradyrhizobium sp.]|jgi:hypothetical protein|uniref:hypothetical protein n=1 Tax=Bradyrhizobium sp. TaxID=376 RepID=UPI002B766056|nr:hypothetical protein [Bradyrhizobium sp.]HXB76308.1 hypothetical protein [Bradyrhizobium sp.]
MAMVAARGTASEPTSQTVMRHAGKGARDFASLRSQLQDFVDKVMAFAKAMKHLPKEFYRPRTPE